MLSPYRRRFDSGEHTIYSMRCKTVCTAYITIKDAQNVCIYIYMYIYIYVHIYIYMCISVYMLKSII